MINYVEYAYNDSVKKSIGRTPFEAIYGFYPRGPMKIRHMHGMKSTSARRDTLVQLMKIVHDQVKDHLEKSMVKHKDRVDQKEMLTYQSNLLLVTHTYLHCV